jgi:aspartyl-tRNA(Asn)/glutamyl-tRNA(Gln) amidotransferase subunit B
MNKYNPVIGLEIHVELSTTSKMFCGCAADWFGKAPNSQTCPVCLGLPGAIPVPNQKAIEWTLLLAKALNCHISNISKFDRKHYFYPDLPKSFQISQYGEPFGANGTYSILNPKIESKPIRIRRVHLEEDTGKLIHKGQDTFIDYNRSGVRGAQLADVAE